VFVFHSLNFGKIIGGVAKTAGKVVGSFLKREDLDELIAREVAEHALAAREPMPEPEPYVVYCSLTILVA
jgi:hypothetical protein